jgi:hypothetical protein
MPNVSASNEAADAPPPTPAECGHQCGDKTACQHTCCKRHLATRDPALNPAPESEPPADTPSPLPVGPRNPDFSTIPIHVDDFSDLLTITPLQAANLRADNNAKALEEANKKAHDLTASFSVALNSFISPIRGNAANSISAATNAGAMFHKMQAKSIKPLAVAPNVTELISFVRSTERLATNGDHPYSLPLQAIMAYAEDASVSAIAKDATDFTSTTWITTVRRIFNLCIAAPGAASRAESALRSFPTRQQAQSIDAYYASYKSVLENTVWVRKLYSKDVSTNWSYPHHVKWVVNLNVQSAFTLSALVQPSFTFADVYNTACQALSPSERAGGNTPKHDRVANIESATTHQRVQDRLDQIEQNQEDIHGKLDAIAKQRRARSRSPPSSRSCTPPRRQSR